MIAGFFDPTTPWPLPAVEITVYVPSLSRRGLKLPFVIDTGAARTCLHPMDAAAILGIHADILAQPDRWSRHVTHQGVGGANLYFREPAYYLFQHDDGHWQAVDGEIDIAQARPENEMLPSVLDWDVLQHFRLVIDWPSRTISLE